MNLKSPFYEDSNWLVHHWTILASSNSVVKSLGEHNSENIQSQLFSSRNKHSNIHRRRVAELNDESFVWHPEHELFSLGSVGLMDRLNGRPEAESRFLTLMDHE